jgi:protein associated with RNAse G/E
MITVFKQDTHGEIKVRYTGEVVKRLPNGIVIVASWTQPVRNLGYTQFEPGDRFVEYYYTDRWFNIFDIASMDGKRKGWYCNVAAPAVISDDTIRQVDLLLDVWVYPDGRTLILDEDEFAADTTLSEDLRAKARRGLQSLLQMIAARQEVFADIAGSSV